MSWIPLTPAYGKRHVGNIWRAELDGGNNIVTRQIAELGTENETQNKTAELEGDPGTYTREDTKNHANAFVELGTNLSTEFIVSKEKRTGIILE
jgi:hypothetical protein